MVKALIAFITVFLLVSCKPATYFVVRHAERASSSTMTDDVPLSDAGKQRAEALKTRLQSENIRNIFSTNYVRTRSTAQPLVDAIGVPLQIYDPRDTGFVTRLKALKGNTLVVGHSNTVDDLVNMLSGKKELPADLNDAQYGDLFVVKKRGSRVTMERQHYGN